MCHEQLANLISRRRATASPGCDDVDVDAAMDEQDGIKMNNGTTPPSPSPSHELPEATAQGPVAEGTAYNA
jgi:hypothetical protein